MRLNTLSFISLFVVSMTLLGCGGGGSGGTDTEDKDPIISVSTTNLIATVGVPIQDITVDSIGGTVKSYSIVPPIGNGLSFNISNGTISGTPIAAAAKVDYVITATNDSGSDTANVAITVINVSSDIDNDYIPNDIETMLGLDMNDSDENNNNVLDGLETIGVFGDEFFEYQWHILSLGTFTNDSNIPTIVGNDLNILEIYHKYMGYNGGNNIIVQVVDTGVDSDHPDLMNNMDFSRSLNGENIGDPSGTDPHGTMVAGIIAAEAFNTIGVRGIIPYAKLAGSNWLEDQTYLGLQRAWVTGTGANEIAVSNNSWGSYFDFDTTYEDMMEVGTTDLRDGKGRIYVFAAGNDRDTNGNANLSYTLSNRYQIAVAALKHTNEFASYSTPGSNILVSGYSGNFYQDSPTISTTYIAGTSSNTGNINTKITWTEDTAKDYTFSMNGTSAASPTVSASIALVLEACPNLSWRDVKYLCAKHAKQIDVSNSTWITNSAGLTHSIDYGYGLINAIDMIGECNSTYTNLPMEKSATEIQTYDILIHDNNTTQSFNILMPDNIIIEWVEVTIDNNSTYASDYKVDLTSPSGTTTRLMTANTDVNQISSLSWMDGGFRMSTAAMIDESSSGNWRVDITDTESIDIGTLKTIQLKIYGH